MRETASELQRQLALHRVRHALPSNREGRAFPGSSNRMKAVPSFLFDVRDAAAVDVETLRELAIQSLDSLSRRQPLFQLLRPLFTSTCPPCAPPVSSPQAEGCGVSVAASASAAVAGTETALFGEGRQKQVTREFLLSTQEHILDARIQLCCALLGPYFLLPDAHNIIEYLLRMHAAHRYPSTAESLLFVALPFHSSLLATRLFRLLQLPATSPWSCCLQKLQQRPTPHNPTGGEPSHPPETAATQLTRPVLIQCCLESPALFLSLIQTTKSICLDGISPQKLKAAALQAHPTLSLAAVPSAAAATPAAVESTTPNSTSFTTHVFPPARNSLFLSQSQSCPSTAVYPSATTSSAATWYLGARSSCSSHTHPTEEEKKEEESCWYPLSNPPLLSLFTHIVIETLSRAPSLHVLRPLLPPLIPFLLEALRPGVAVILPEMHAAAAAVCLQLARRAPIEQTTLISIVQQLSLTVAAIATAAANPAAGVGPLQQMQLLHGRKRQQHQLISTLILLTQQQPFLQHTLPLSAVQTLAKYPEILASSLYTVAFRNSRECTSFLISFFRTALSSFFSATTAEEVSISSLSPSSSRSSTKNLFSMRQRRLLAAAEMICMTLGRRRNSSRSRWGEGSVQQQQQQEQQQQQLSLRCYNNFHDINSNSSSSMRDVDIVSTATATGDSNSRMLVVITLTLFDAFAEAARIVAAAVEGSVGLQEEEETAAGDETANITGNISSSRLLDILEKKYPLLLAAVGRLLRLIEGLSPLSIPTAFSFSTAASRSNSRSIEVLLLLAETYDRRPHTLPSFAVLPPTHSAALPAAAVSTAKQSVEKERFSRYALYTAMISSDAAVRREAVRAAVVSLHDLEIHHQHAVQTLQQQQHSQLHIKNRHNRKQYKIKTTTEEEKEKEEEESTTEEEKDGRTKEEEEEEEEEEGKENRICISNIFPLAEDGRVLLLRNMILKIMSDDDMYVCKEALLCSEKISGELLPPLLSLHQCETVLSNLLLLLDEEASSDCIAAGGGGGRENLLRRTAADIFLEKIWKHPRLRLLLPVVLHAAGAAARSSRGRSSSSSNSSSSIISAATADPLQDDEEAALFFCEEEFESEQRILVSVHRILPVALAVLWGCFNNRRSISAAAAGKRAASQQTRGAEEPQQQQQEEEEEGKQQDPTADESTLEAAALLLLEETWHLLLKYKLAVILAPDETVVGRDDTAAAREEQQKLYGNDAAANTASANTASANTAAASTAAANTAAAGTAAATERARAAGEASAAGVTLAGRGGRETKTGGGEDDQQHQHSKKKKKKEEIPHTLESKRSPKLPPYFVPILRFALLGPRCCYRLLFDACSNSNSSSSNNSNDNSSSNTTRQQQQGSLFYSSGLHYATLFLSSLAEEERRQQQEMGSPRGVLIADDKAGTCRATGEEIAAALSSSLGTAAVAAEQHTPFSTYHYWWLAAVILEAAGAAAGAAGAAAEDNTSLSCCCLQQSVPAVFSPPHTTGAAGAAIESAHTECCILTVVELLRHCVVLQQQVQLIDCRGSKALGTAARDNKRFPLFIAAARHAVSNCVDRIAALFFSISTERASAADISECLVSPNSSRKKNDSSSNNSKASTNSDSSSNTTSKSNRNPVRYGNSSNSSRKSRSSSSSNSSSSSSSNELSSRSSMGDEDIGRRWQREGGERIHSRHSKQQESVHTKRDSNNNNSNRRKSAVVLPGAARLLLRSLRDSVLFNNLAVNQHENAAAFSSSSSSSSFYCVSDLHTVDTSHIIQRSPSLEEDTATAAARVSTDTSCAGEQSACSIARVLLLLIFSDLELYAAAAQNIMSLYEGHGLLMVALLTRLAAELVYTHQHQPSSLSLGASHLLQQQHPVAAVEGYASCEASGNVYEDEDSLIVRHEESASLYLMNKKKNEDVEPRKLEAGNARRRSAVAAVAADAVRRLVAASQWQSITVNCLDVTLILLHEEEKEQTRHAAAAAIAVLLAPQWMLLLLRLQHNTAPPAAQKIVKQLMHMLLQQLNLYKKEEEKEEEEEVEMSDDEGSLLSERARDIKEKEKQRSSSLLFPQEVLSSWQYLIACGVLLQPVHMPLKRMLMMLQISEEEGCVATEAATHARRDEKKKTKRVSRLKGCVVSGLCATSEEPGVCTPEKRKEQEDDKSVALAAEMTKGCQELLSLFLIVFPAAVEEETEGENSKELQQLLLFAAAVDAASSQSTWRTLCHSLLLLLPLKQQQQHLSLLLSACTPSRIIPHLLPLAQVYIHLLQQTRILPFPSAATAVMTAATTGSAAAASRPLSTDSCPAAPAAAVTARARATPAGTGARLLLAAAAAASSAAAAAHVESLPHLPAAPAIPAAASSLLVDMSPAISISSSFALVLTLACELLQQYKQQQLSGNSSSSISSSRKKKEKNSSNSSSNSSPLSAFLKRHCSAKRGDPEGEDCSSVAIISFLYNAALPFLQLLSFSEERGTTDNHTHQQQIVWAHSLHASSSSSAAAADCAVDMSSISCCIHRRSIEKEDNDLVSEQQQQTQGGRKEDLLSVQQRTAGILLVRTLSICLGTLTAAKPYLQLLLARALLTAACTDTQFLNAARYIFQQQQQQQLVFPQARAAREYYHSKQQQQQQQLLLLSTLQLLIRGMYASREMKKLFCAAGGTATAVLDVNVAATAAAGGTAETAAAATTTREAPTAGATRAAGAGVRQVEEEAAARVGEREAVSKVRAAGAAVELYEDELAVEIVRDQLQRHLLQLQHWYSNIERRSSNNKALPKAEMQLRGIMTDALMKLETLFLDLLQQQQTQQQQQQRSQQQRSQQQQQQIILIEKKHSKQGETISWEEKEEVLLSRVSRVADGLLNILRIAAMCTRLIRGGNCSSSSNSNSSNSNSNSSSNSRSIEIVCGGEERDVYGEVLVEDEEDGMEKYLNSFTRCCCLLASCIMRCDSPLRQQQKVVTLSLLRSLLHCCCVLIRCCSESSEIAENREKEEQQDDEIANSNSNINSNSSSNSTASAESSLFFCSVFSLVQVKRGVASVLAATAAAAPALLQTAGCLLLLETYIPPVIAAVAAADAAGAQQRDDLLAAEDSDITDEKSNPNSSTYHRKEEGKSITKQQQQYHSYIAEGETVGLCYAVLSPLCEAALSSYHLRNSLTTTATAVATPTATAAATAGAVFLLVAKTLVKCLGISAWLGVACTLLRCWEARNCSIAADSKETDKEEGDDKGNVEKEEEEREEEVSDGENDITETKRWLASRANVFQCLDNLLQHACTSSSSFSPSSSSSAESERETLSPVIYSTQLRALSKLASAAVLFFSLGKQQQQQQYQQQQQQQHINTDIFSSLCSSVKSTITDKMSSSPAAAQHISSSHNSSNRGEKEEEEEGYTLYKQSREEETATGDGENVFLLALRKLPRATRRLLQGFVEGLSAGSRTAAAITAAAAAASNIVETTGAINIIATTAIMRGGEVTEEENKEEQEEEKKKKKEKKKKRDGEELLSDEIYISTSSLLFSLYCSRTASSALLYIFMQLRSLGLPTLEAVYYHQQQTASTAATTATAAAAASGRAKEEKYISPAIGRDAATAAAATAAGDVEYESLLELTQALLSMEVLLEFGQRVRPPQLRDNRETAAAAEEKEGKKERDGGYMYTTAEQTNISLWEEERWQLHALAAAEDKLLQQRVAVLLNNLFKALSPLVGCMRIALGCLSPDTPHTFFLSSPSNNISNMYIQQFENKKKKGVEEQNKNNSALDKMSVALMFSVRRVLSDTFLPRRNSLISSSAITSQGKKQQQQQMQQQQMQQQQMQQRQQVLRRSVQYKGEQFPQIVEQEILRVSVGEGRLATAAARDRGGAGVGCSETAEEGAAVSKLLHATAMKCLQQEETPMLLDVLLWGALLRRLFIRLQQHVAQEAAAARNAAVEDLSEDEQEEEKNDGKKKKKKHNKKQKNKLSGVQTPQDTTTRPNHDLLWHHLSAPWSAAALGPAYALLLAVVVARFLIPAAPAALKQMQQQSSSRGARIFSSSSSAAAAASAAVSVSGQQQYTSSSKAAAAVAAAKGYAWRYTTALAALVSSYLPLPFRSTCLAAVTLTLRHAAAATATAGGETRRGEKQQMDISKMMKDEYMSSAIEACRCLAALALPKTSLSSIDASTALLPQFNMLVQCLLLLLRQLLTPPSLPRGHLQQLQQQRQQQQQQQHHLQQEEEGEEVLLHEQGEEEKYGEIELGGRVMQQQQQQQEQQESRRGLRYTEDEMLLQMKLYVYRMQQQETQEAVECLLAALLALLQDIPLSFYIEYVPQLLELLVHPFLYAVGQQQQRALLALARCASSSPVKLERNVQAPSVLQQQLAVRLLTSGVAGDSMLPTEQLMLQGDNASSSDIPNEGNMTAAARRVHVRQQLLLLLLRLGGGGGGKGEGEDDIKRDSPPTKNKKKKKKRKNHVKIIEGALTTDITTPVLGGVFLKSLDRKIAAEVSFKALLRLLLPLISACMSSSQTRGRYLTEEREEEEDREERGFEGEGGEEQGRHQKNVQLSYRNTRCARALQDCKTARLIDLLADAIAGLQQREADLRYNVLQNTLELLVELYMKRVEAAARTAAEEMYGNIYTATAAKVKKGRREGHSDVYIDAAALLYGGDLIDIYGSLLFLGLVDASDTITNKIIEDEDEDEEEEEKQKRSSLKKEQRMQRVEEETEQQVRDVHARGSYEKQKCGITTSTTGAAVSSSSSCLSEDNNNNTTLAIHLPSTATMKAFLPAAVSTSGSMAACIENSLLRCMRCWIMKLSIEQLREWLLQLVRNMKCGNATLLQQQEITAATDTSLLQRADRERESITSKKRKRRVTIHPKQQQQQQRQEDVYYALGAGYAIKEICGVRLFVLLFWAVLDDYGEVGAVEALFEEILPDLESIMAACSNNAAANIQAIRHINKKQKRGERGLAVEAAESEQQKQMILRSCCSPAWWWFEVGYPTLLSLRLAVSSWDITTSGELPTAIFQRLLTTVLHALQVLAALPQLPLSSSACADVQTAATEYQLQKEEAEEDQQILSAVRNSRGSSKSTHLIARLWLLALRRFIEALFEICGRDKQRLLGVQITGKSDDKTEELNLVLLEKLRSCKNSSVRCAGITVYIHLWKKYRLAMVDCLNDSLPVLGELMEDADEQVEFSTRQLIRCIEQITNESLTERLKF